MRASARGRAGSRLAIAALCVAACTSTGVGNLTHGALDELRRAEPGLLDPDTLHDVTAALSSGVRIGPELRSDVNRLMIGALAPVGSTVEAILAALREQLLALVDGLDGPLGRLAHRQLAELRREIRGTIRDVDVELQRLIDHTTSRLAEQLRTSVGPALRDGVIHALEEGSDQIAYRATTGAGRGLVQQVGPAVNNVSRGLIGEATGGDDQFKMPKGLSYAFGLGAGALIAYLLWERRRTHELLLDLHERQGRASKVPDGP